MALVTRELEIFEGESQEACHIKLETRIWVEWFRKRHLGDLEMVTSVVKEG